MLFQIVTLFCEVSVSQGYALLHLSYVRLFVLYSRDVIIIS